MGNKNKRIRFAEDVLSLLSEDTIEVQDNCGYFYLKLPHKISTKKELSTVLDRWLGEKKVKISVCALGSLFVAAVLSENELKVKELRAGAKFKHLGLDQTEIYDYLSSFFSEEQLGLIESAFEICDIWNYTFDKKEVQKAIEFGLGFSSKKKRLKAIMKNIINNGGVFTPPASSTPVVSF